MSNQPRDARGRFREEESVDTLWRITSVIGFAVSVSCLILGMTMLCVLLSN